MFGFGKKKREIMPPLPDIPLFPSEAPPVPMPEDEFPHPEEMPLPPVNFDEQKKELVVKTFPQKIETHLEASFISKHKFHGLVSEISKITSIANSLVTKNSMIESQQKAKLEETRMIIEGIERKLLYIDKTLFGG